jgi:fatty acid amide hydrolase 2
VSEAELLQRGVVDLAAAVRAGEVTPVELVEAHVRRIEALQPQLNALVADRFEAALSEARAAQDEARAARPELAAHLPAKPLLGVPFTAKEMLAVRGLPATYGNAARRGRVAARDATVVARLRAAGAIPLGVSNVPEWGMWCETYNEVYGRTNNPYDLKRTPGGSSGGEGALVGAGGSPLGLGSDIGGSVRMPAAFCGVFGHKPTHGLLPLTGHHPVYVDRDWRHGHPGSPMISPYLAIGPLARCARDLMPLLRIMAGPDGTDPNAEPLPLGDPAAVQWAGRRVLLLPAPRIPRTRRTAPALRDAVAEAGAVFEAAGAAVGEAPSDLMQRAGDIWFAALQSVGGPSFTELLADGNDLRLLPEVAAALFGRGRYSWPALFFGIGERIGRQGGARLQAALAEGRRVARRFDQLVGDGGVLIAPVHPRPAPRHNEPALFPFDFLHTGFFNALRVPATAVPFGFGRSGLPLSVQVAAGRGNDHLAIAAAMLLEAVQPAWRPAAVPDSLVPEAAV